MGNHYLNLEQVRFITATVAPYFGPKIDQSALDRVWQLSDIHVGIRHAFAAHYALTRLIVAEVDGDDASTLPVGTLGGRAAVIIGMTLAAHGDEAVADAIIDELCKHSRAMAGEPRR